MAGEVVDVAEAMKEAVIPMAVVVEAIVETEEMAVVELVKTLFISTVIRIHIGEHLPKLKKPNSMAYVHYKKIANVE
jgi:hypothetical protein